MNKKNKIASLFVALAFCFAISTSIFYSKTSVIAKTESNKKQKEQQKESNIQLNNLSVATISVSDFSFNAIILIFCSLVSIPISTKIIFAEQVPRIKIKYWSNLFSSTILVNAP